MRKMHGQTTVDVCRFVCKFDMKSTEFCCKGTSLIQIGSVTMIHCLGQPIKFCTSFDYLFADLGNRPFVKSLLRCMKQCGLCMGKGKVTGVIYLRK